MATDAICTALVAALARHGHTVSPTQVQSMIHEHDEAPFALTHRLQQQVTTTESLRDDIVARRRRDIERMAAITASSSSGSITCRGCGAASVIIQQKQTRSADEGMTVFCACEHCGKQWRMN